MEFLYLPPTTERTLNSTGRTLIGDHLSINSRKEPIRPLPVPIPTSDPIIPITAPLPMCDVLTVDFCLDHNTTFIRGQRPLSEALLAQMRLVVASRCHPFATHFLCAWGMACEGPQPCLDYCEEFLSNCASVLPAELKSKLRCEGSKWEGTGSCVPKPGCVESLYRSGQGQRVCDGVMDCFDFSDVSEYHS